MINAPRISVVMPVRDGASSIRDRIDQLLAALDEMTEEEYEVVVVDDGSRDRTVELLSSLSERIPQIRIVRHNRPRGMEAAGQTGLERATGELVFIQESDTAVRIEDLRRLFEMSGDPSVVAARAESNPQPASRELLRRLRAWGTNADRQLADPASTCSSIQMIRRPHLQTLASPRGQRYRLQSETMYETTLQAT